MNLNPSIRNTVKEPEIMSDTEKDWRTDRAENLKRLGCLIAVLCFAAVIAGLFTPLQSRGARAEKLLQKGIAAYEAKDYENAAMYYKEAAEQGDAMAQNMLALCYDTGEGVKQDYVMAANWYCNAAEQGNASAQLNLGACYADGHGVGLDSAEAVKWYRKAAEQGNELAIEALKRLGVK